MTLAVPPAARRELTGADVRLRLVEAADAAALLAFYVDNREHLEPFEPERGPRFYTLVGQQALLAERLEALREGRDYPFVILRNSALIGKLTLSNVVRGPFMSAFVGYGIDRRHENRGYMKQALGLALDFAFDGLGLNRVEASTLLDNVRSQRVLEANGFTRLGLNRCYLCIAGTWRDHVTYYKLARDRPPR